MPTRFNRRNSTARPRSSRERNGSSRSSRASSSMASGPGGLESAAKETRRWAAVGTIGVAEVVGGVSTPIGMPSDPEGREKVGKWKKKGCGASLLCLHLNKTLRLGFL